MFFRIKTIFKHKINKGQVFLREEFTYMVIDMNYWNKVLKNIFILTLSIIIVYFSFKLAVFFMPFLVAFVISLMLEPIIKFIMKKTKLTRRTSSIIVFIIAIVIICGILVWGITTLISEASNLLTNLNTYIDTGYNMFQTIVSSIDLSKINVPEEVMNIVQNSGMEFLETATDWAKGVLTNVIDFITSMPTLGVYTGIALIALYFICVDKIYMIDQLEHHLPETWVKRIGVHLRTLVKSLGGYLKAELTLVLISFFISLVGLYIFYFIGWNIEFPLIIAIGIAFVDALPIFGSGTVMIPWAGILAFSGDMKLAIGIFVLWCIMSIVRQFIEPRIVSAQIGIHPIFTLIAMYTGFRFLGVWGLLLGPIVLIILKNIYGTVIDRGVVKSILER